MLEHVVMFKFKGTEGERRTIARRFKNALEPLFGRIPCLLNLEVGVNNNPRESWDLTLHATVNNYDDLEAYANHPAHLQAVATVKEHIADRACVDYEGDDFDD